MHATSPAPCAARRRAYLRHVMAENQQLEMERNVMRQYERDLDAYEAHQASTDAGVAGKFFNKDQDRRALRSVGATAQRSMRRGGAQGTRGSREASWVPGGDRAGSSGCAG